MSLSGNEIIRFGYRDRSNTLKPDILILAQQFSGLPLSFSVESWYIKPVNQRQKESTAKYLYDISKGIAILAVVGNMVQGKWGIVSLALGFIGAFAFFISAYLLEGEVNNE